MYKDGTAEAKRSTRGFFIVHHEMSGVDDRLAEVRISETFPSPLECLADMRGRRIPAILREASGLAGETDIQVLLDGCGYSVSFVAEELLGMIDDCLSSGGCSPEELRMMREVYNSLSSFHRGRSRSIRYWGHVRRMSGIEVSQRSGHSISSPAAVDASLQGMMAV
ncbi:MAG: hypothetical protein AVO35_06920 [Candidatus Aegiribacteria sp. MLS_C]|nr:MAG: hypothetical protein AVO35_06920 [Candidatus Aegiribacteria sp. MLS_C]